MLQKRFFVLKVLVLVRTLMLIKMTFVDFLRFLEAVVVEEVVDEAVEDAVVVDEFSPSYQNWHRATGPTHTVGLLSLCQHRSRLGLALYPTLEMLQQMISNSTECRGLIDEAAAIDGTRVNSQGDLGRRF